MKKISCIFFIGILSSFAEAQISVDLGATTGTSFYLGDINPDDLFYNPKLSFGGFVRFNFKDRYSLRINGQFLSLKANDLDFKNRYQQRRAENFDTDLVEISGLLEFNFVSFTNPPGKKQKPFSPYIVTGISYAYSSNTTSSFAIPMGMGIKFILITNLTASVEWAMRKTFTDKLDDLDDPIGAGSSSTLFNNDWYSYTGLMISYRLFGVRSKCNTYDSYQQKYKTKRRRRRKK